MRDRECNTRTKDIGGLSEEITDLGKDLGRVLDKAGTAGATFASAKDELCRLTSDIDGVR